MLKHIDYKTLFENINIGIIVIEADGVISAANKKVLQILRIPENKFLHTPFLKWIYDKKDVTPLRKNHFKRLRGEESELPQSYDVKFISGSSYIDVLISITYFKESSQTVISVLDNTKLKRVQNKLEDTINYQYSILSAIPDLMFEFSKDGEFLNVWASNPQELTVKKEHLLGNNINDILPHSVAKIVMQTIKEALNDGRSNGNQIRILTTDDELWFSLSASLKNNKDAEPSIIMLSRNITQTKKLEFKLLHLSRHDPLTNLYNRRVLEEMLEKDAHRSRRYNTPLSACMLDIDHFKEINDTYGHHMGDKVLQDLSALLRKNLRDIDYCGRYGGEEFVIVLPQTTLAHASEFAHRLLKQIASLRFQSAENIIFHITASIGVAEFDTSDRSHEKLLHAADEAMYLAKNSGRNCIKEYIPSKRE